jgi:hypothetical protein
MAVKAKRRGLDLGGSGAGRDRSSPRWSKLGVTWLQLQAGQRGDSPDAANMILKIRIVNGVNPKIQD